MSKVGLETNGANMVFRKHRSVDSYCLCMAHTGCCHHNRAATITPPAARCLCHDNADAMGISSTNEERNRLLSVECYL